LLKLDLCSLHFFPAIPFYLPQELLPQEVHFDVYLLAVLLITAAIAGDNVNYWVGRKLGIKLFERFNKLLKREYLEKTHKFYEKHGGKTIILARFFPIIRTSPLL